MPDQLDKALQYARTNQDKFLDAFKEILAIPSVSTDPMHTADMLRAAEWMAGQLRSNGMDRVQVFATRKHPLVYGEWLGAEGAPTVLLYGHYDVQPAEPLNLWKTDPFMPAIRGEEMIARGASDMKGQDVILLKAVESLVKTGGLPVNIKWLVEGEEEIGSPSLDGFISTNKELLASDFALNADSGMLGKDYPTITYALRGLAYFELYIYGPTHDLHSGIFGGVIHNPANALAELIAGMHDEHGKVTLPGFYDRVFKMSVEDHAELERLPIDDKHFLDITQVPALSGEEGYTANERTGARPTLDVNGIISGFTGEGSKTIIPAWAMAKISLRLVPEQDPKEVQGQFIKYLEMHTPKDIRWELKTLSCGAPSISSRNNIGVQAMKKALESVWGIQPYFRREGGSIPVVADMQKLLGIESVISGFGLPDDNVHSPNEKMHLPTFQRGIEAIIHFFMNLKP